MKPWKYVLLAAGLLGAIAIFMPMVTIRKGFFEQDFSTRDLVFNGEQTRQTLNGKIPKIAMQHLPKSLQSLRSDLQDVLLAARALSAVFVPAMLLLLLGGFAVYRGACGRVIGAAAVLLGVASMAGWFALRWGLREYGTDSINIQLSSGATMLLVVGALGVVGGIGALLQPEKATGLPSQAASPPLA
jgi:hypothetical protein